MISRRLTPAQVLENYQKLNPPPKKQASPGDYMALVEARMSETGESKAEAMRQTTRRHPDAHRLWIEQVNQ